MVRRNKPRMHFFSIKLLPKRRCPLPKRRNQVRGQNSFIVYIFNNLKTLNYVNVFHSYNHTQAQEPEACGSSSLGKVTLGPVGVCVDDPPAESVFWGYSTPLTVAGSPLVYSLTYSLGPAFSPLSQPRARPLLLLSRILQDLANASPPLPTPNLALARCSLTPRPLCMFT